jgi:hypothetical protein
MPAQFLHAIDIERPQLSQVLAAEHKAAAQFLPQLDSLQTVDGQGHTVTVKKDEAAIAQQLAHGIFAWGSENPDTGDIRLDCTDTLANAGSNGGRMNRFWGGKTAVDACGPRDHCEDECAYEVPFDVVSRASCIQTCQKHAFICCVMYAVDVV